MKTTRVWLLACVTALIVVAVALIGAPAASTAALSASGPGLATDSDLWRWGLAASTLDSAEVSDLLNMGVRWYQNWQFNPETAAIGSLEYMPTALPSWRPTDACTIPGDGVTITQKITQDTNHSKYPNGTIWLLGNEVGLYYNGNTQIWTAADYAQRYRRCYRLLKGIEPYNAEIASRNFQIATTSISPEGSYTSGASGGIDWLRIVRASYLSQFGEVMPIDVYNIHLYAMAANMPRLITGTINFRTAMAGEWDARDKPLIVTEVGMWQTANWDASVSFLNQMVDFFNSAADPAIGNSTDGNRLVQRWAWFTNTRPEYADSQYWYYTNLYDDVGARTVLGNAYGVKAHATPTNTPPPSATRTTTRTLTPTGTRTLTPTHTPSRTATFTVTPTPTRTFTNTPTRTRTFTNTPTRTITSTPSQTATPTMAPPYDQRVNCGGTAYTDTQGKLWAADKAFTAGSWGYVSGKTFATTAAIAQTLDDTLYQSERYWNATTTPGYRFTVPINGLYEVTLKFAEIYHDAAGSRKFDVTIEGATVLANFDIYADAGGKNIAATDKVFIVNVADGEVSIGFIQIPNFDTPKVSAIQITWAGPAATATPTLTPTPTSTATPELDAFEIVLSPGWNLISSPLSPVPATLPEVLVSVEGQYDLVYGYSAGGAASSWTLFDVTAPPFLNDLSAITEAMGIWINVTDTVPATVTFIGAEAESPSIQLYAGWNLVGYPSLVTRPVAEALASCADKFDLVYAYVASDASPWKVYDATVPPMFNDLTDMEPGRGYWINATQECTWQVAGEP
jgi:Malectin domain/Glycosyl hydrolase catalytic core